MHTDPVLQNLDIILDLRTLPSVDSWYRKQRRADQVTPRQDRAYSQELHAEGLSHRASAQRGRLALANSLRRLIRQDRQLHPTVTVRKILAAQILCSLDASSVTLLKVNLDSEECILVDFIYILL
jgi:hypothetical protein